MHHQLVHGLSPYWRPVWRGRMYKHNWRAYRAGEFCKMGDGYERGQDCEDDARAVLSDPVGNYDRVELLTDGNLCRTLRTSATEEAK